MSGGMSRNSVEAHFWVTPGVEVFQNTLVPYPPPREWRVAMMEPMQWLRERDRAIDILAPHHAEFRLSNWAEGGEVAHYEIVASPRKGYRWLVVNGELRAERIS